jgi:DNA-binding NtrC family response regulator
VLIAEDEEHLGTILEHFLRGRGYDVMMCRDGRSALAALHAESYDVALLDIVMPGMDGLEVLRQLQVEADPPQVIIITGNGTIDTAITAIKLGAYDYIAKPYRMAEIDVMIRRAWEKRELTKANMFLRARLPMPGEIETHNSRMRDVIDQATTLADSSEHVILHGELGVGKTHLARYIHSRSGRLVDAYAEISSPAASGILSQLFGEESSATPGVTSRHGIVQLAEHGTVVVDTGALTADEFAVLADVLAQRSYTRVGGTQRIPLRARMIVCTPSDHRDSLTLAGSHITIPSLRERLEDLESLSHTLLQSIGDGAMRRVSSDALLLLREYPWPGNVRELGAVLTRAAVLAPAPEITMADLRMVLIWTSMNAAGEGEALADLERQHIEAVLQRSNWHQGRAAEALGISTKTLYRKIREYGFKRPRNRKLSRGSRGRASGGPSAS